MNKVRTVGTHLRETLPGQPSVQSNLDLLVRELVNWRFTIERDPFVCLELRKVGSAIEVVANILAIRIDRQ